MSLVGCSLGRSGAPPTNREAGTYFEELTACYLMNEPKYRDLHKEVLPFAVWAKRSNLSLRDTGPGYQCSTSSTDPQRVHALGQVQVPTPPRHVGLRRGPAAYPSQVWTHSG